MEWVSEDGAGRGLDRAHATYNLVISESLRNAVLREIALTCRTQLLACFQVMFLIATLK